MRERGLTLAELVVAIGITLIISTLLVSILINQSGVFNRQSGVVNVGVNLNDTVSKINSNIMQASAVASGYPEISPEFVTGPSVLVLKLVSVDENGPVSNIYDYVVISKDANPNNILRLQVFPDPQSIRVSANSVLTSLLESVQFRYLDSGGNAVAPTVATSVGLDLTVTYQAGSMKSSRTSHAVTSLRNML